MANFYSDESEWRWLFKNGIDWKTIIPLYFPNFPSEDGFESNEDVISFLEELLTSTGEWASVAVQGRAESLDRHGAGKVVDGRTIPGEELSQLYREAKELEVFGLPIGREYGGLGLPVAPLMMLLGQLSRACISSCTQLAFFTSIAEMVHRFCTEKTAKRIIPRILAGELSGSMCLTEPGCGSDLGMIATSATPHPKGDGTYLINGSKIFITNGGGGIGFVLARLKDAPAGIEGISMFFVEQDHPGKEGLNFQVAKNEDKMGLHGSFTCEVVYENSIGCLVGKEGEGFKYMLHLMNEARIGCGMQALGGLEAAIGYARQYADERVQFGKSISQLPLMKRNLSDFETERDAIRALMVDTISHFDIFQKLDLKMRHGVELSKEEKELFEEAQLWTRKRTPLVKYYSCEAFTALSQRAIQVLGGYGFMREYPVERFHRDSFGPLLYEGTSQIQALMSLKDLVKYAMKDPKRFFSNVFLKHPGAGILKGDQSWQTDFQAIQYRFKKKMLGLFLKCLRPESASKILDMKAWTNEENVDGLMAHAETLCQAMCYIETLRVLCEHATKEKARLGLFNRYKILVQPRLEGIYSDWSVR